MQASVALFAIEEGNLFGLAIVLSALGLIKPLIELSDRKNRDTLRRHPLACWLLIVGFLLVMATLTTWIIVGFPEPRVLEQPMHEQNRTCALAALLLFLACGITNVGLYPLRHTIVSSGRLSGSVWWFNIPVGFGSFFFIGMWFLKKVL